jgi:hypothetical protein
MDIIRNHRVGLGGLITHFARSFWLHNSLEIINPYIFIDFQCGPVVVTYELKPDVKGINYQKGLES